MKEKIMGSSTVQAEKLRAQIRESASQAQGKAADPAHSAWVRASAGTGKTKVLVDRFLRLLLEGVAPDKILCLTYTKAAAAEMSQRLMGTLAEWVRITSDELQEKLVRLLGNNFEPETESVLLVRARQLFAEVLDAPGGLKIFTLHGFCQSILRRFPLEAEVPPYFKVIEPHQADQHLRQAFHAALHNRNGQNQNENDSYAELLNDLFATHDERALLTLLRETLSRQRQPLEQLLFHHQHEVGLVESCAKELCFDTEMVLAVGAEDCLLGQLVAALDEVALKTAADIMASGLKKDKKQAAGIHTWLTRATPDRITHFDELRTQFLTKDDEILKQLMSKKQAESHPEILESRQSMALQIQQISRRRKELRVARINAAFNVLARRVFVRYQALKSLTADLDYEDLIQKTLTLLQKPGVAPWIMYKLDGGLDHILLDEAQDNSATQWQILKALSEEFFAGEDDKENGGMRRTIFVVGDAKQSIYSFQGAAPAEFLEMQRYFAQRIVAAAQGLATVPLSVSFRSAAPVLEAVNAVFSEPLAAAGLLQDEPLKHTAARAGAAGRVVLWPRVTGSSGQEIYSGSLELQDTFWPIPTAYRPRDKAAGQLAASIAGQIRAWIEDERPLLSQGRGVEPGDILILVQRRNAFVDLLIRALKDQDIPVAGADRLRITEHIAVEDMLALCQFLLLPDDDLTLAVILKSPLCGLTEEELFTLAHDRGALSLWQRLRQNVEQGQAEPYKKVSQEAYEFLSALLARVDYLTPYRLLYSILVEFSGREKFYARLGSECQDALDELLNLAMMYEQTQPPSLQGFLSWIAEGETEIRRDLDHRDGKEVRIMTVHGAKGLQAPIVFLADTLGVPDGTKIDLGVWPEGSDHFVLLPSKDSDVPLTEKLKQDQIEARRAEHKRLLYVAMTRAEDELYVCGYQDSLSTSIDKALPPPKPESWYALIRDGLAKVARPAEEKENLATASRDALAAQDQGYVLESPQTAAIESDRTSQEALPKGESLEVSLPAWLNQSCDPSSSANEQPSAPSSPLTPSQQVRQSLMLDGSTDHLKKDLEPSQSLSPLGGTVDQMRYGQLVHALLEILSTHPLEQQEDMAKAYLAATAQDVGPHHQADMIAEALAVLGDPDLSHVFGPGTMAEVPVAAYSEGQHIMPHQMRQGRIDRLIVTTKTLTIVDFKTNRLPAKSLEDLQERFPNYVAQLSAYAEMMASAYPGRTVAAGIVWTKTRQWMNVPQPLISGCTRAT